MKKIVPFNNVLNFETDVREITAISLEHDIKKEPDAISGVFYITGEYKITEGELKKETFSFELPFDIALGCTYNLDTIIVDIDDFRYELLDNKKLKVNIDLYIDGEETTSDESDLFTEKEVRELTEEPSNSTNEDIQVSEEPTPVEINERLDLLDEMLTDDKENEKMIENNNENNNENDNINIFNGFNEEEKYVTYHVYPFTENDTLDKVIEKYHTTKEELAKYNKLDDLKTGDKLIIPEITDDK